MNYIPVKDLKRTKMIQDELSKQHELVITKNGKPCALMIEVESQSLEETLQSVRRALFASSISSARRKAVENPISDEAISEEISASRKTRIEV